MADGPMLRSKSLGGIDRPPQLESGIKERNNPHSGHSREQIADRITSLRPSDHSSPKENGFCQVQHRIHGCPIPPQGTTQPQQATSVCRLAMWSLAVPIPYANPSLQGSGRAPAGFLSDPDQRRLRVPNNSTKFGIY